MKQPRLNGKTAKYVSLGLVMLAGVYASDGYCTNKPKMSVNNTNITQQETKFPKDCSQSQKTYTINDIIECDILAESKLPELSNKLNNLDVTKINGIDVTGEVFLEYTEDGPYVISLYKIKEKPYLINLTKILGKNKTKLKSILGDGNGKLYSIDPDKPLTIPKKYMNE